MTLDAGTPPPSQEETPLADALLAYRTEGKRAFHTPGHKQGAGAPPALLEALGPAFLGLDMGIANGLDDTQLSGGFLQHAERLAAAAWGGDEAFFLVNGSTSGMQALVVALAGPGETLIVPRNAHKSLLAGLIFSGAMPVWVEPEVDPVWGVATNVRADRFLAALRRHATARALLVTSPSYNGFCADVRTLAVAAHAAGVPLVVDQAWGAHLRFCSSLPEDALSAGADAAVLSVHKLLSGLSQSSLVVARAEGVDLGRLRTVIAMLQTTSPLAPILASIDVARAQMVAGGEALWGRALTLADEARRSIAAVPGLAVLQPEDVAASGFAFDPVRVTLSAAELGCSGFALERLLRSGGIAVEAADPRSVIVNITYADTPESVAPLTAALGDIARALAADRVPAEEETCGPSSTESAAFMLPPPAHADQVMTPREAFFARARSVPLAEAVGAVSTEMVIPYPPGIPVLGPGEEISADLVEYLQEAAARGLHVHGPQDGSLRTLRVVA